VRNAGLPACFFGRWLARRVLLLGWVAALLVLTAGRAVAAGDWQAPLQPVRVTRAFAPGPTPYSAGHRGVDLAGHPGEPVRAAAAGVVSYAGELAGRGVVVVVHGALRTTYEPVRATVRRDTRVERGVQIGTLDPGHQGCPVAACLHWGLLRGDVYLDPMTLLSRPQVRLLPLKGGPVPAERASAVERAQVLPADEHAAAPEAVVPAIGPSAATWSLVALAGAGTLLAFRRR
jgi:hypothetical protein